MLTLTENARTVVKAIAAQEPAEQNTGLRISSAPESEADFAVNVVPQPEPSDQVVEAQGAKVFLDDGAAEALADRVLDAHVDDEGRVSFEIGVAESE